MTEEHVSGWFGAWLVQHKANNPHNGWVAFERDGSALVYLGWMKAFDELGVTRRQADAASLKLQRSGECWPADHLARLLAILSPMIADRRSAEDTARRRDTSTAWAAEQDARREARARFRELPAGEASSRLARIAARYPSLARLPAFVEWFAVDEWRGVPLPEPMPPSETPAVAAGPSPPTEEELPLTPGQVAFLDTLDDGRLARLGAMSAARRGQILALFADRFDSGVARVAAAELQPSSRRPETASA